MKRDGTWDVRPPPAVVAWRREHIREPYYWKVNRLTALMILHALALAYKVPPPNLSEELPPLRGPNPPNDKRGGLRFNGSCHYEIAGKKKQKRTSTIRIHPRGHVKTVFHEFYHHLEWVTNHKYDSSDSKKYAWIFADMMWAALKEAQ